MIKCNLAILGIGLIIAMILSSCSTESPPPWDWWTHDDTIAVENELSLWRDTLNGYNFIRGQNGATLAYPIAVNVPIVGSDTMSTTGDSLVKIAHFVGFINGFIDSTHTNEFIFSVKNDTIEGDTWPRDTFCLVTYKDTVKNCIGILQYDSLWIVKFYPDMIIDTTTVPPETIIIYKKDTLYKRGFSATQEESKEYSFTAMKKLELRKEIGQLKYNLKYLTGFGMSVPNSTTAPTISYIVLSKPGRSDTFRYSPRTDGKGIYNLKDKDSLYTIAPGESVSVFVVTSTPSDTFNNRNYFFIGAGNPFVAAKSNITTSARRGETRLAFTNVGVAHLYVEVIPASAIFYPYTSQWHATTWALSIRVKE